LRRGTVAAGVAVLLLCTACAETGNQVSEAYEAGVGGGGVTHDEALSDDIRELSRRGGTAKLADLTDFAWEKVHVFSEGASARQVERAVGEPVLGDKFYYDAGNLLVFEYNGKVSKAVSVLPDLLVTDGRRSWGPGTVLKPQTRSRNTLLRLSEE